MKNQNNKSLFGVQLIDYWILPLLVLLNCTFASAQQKNTPISKVLLLNILNEGKSKRDQVNISEWIEIIKNRGVNFELKSIDEQNIRKAGSYLKPEEINNLIAVIKDNYRARKSPNEPSFESTPIYYLINQLKSPSEATRENAADALGKMGLEASRAISALVAVLIEDTNSSVKIAATKAIRLIKPTSIDAINALIIALKDGSDTPLRIAAAQALFEIAPSSKEAKSALKIALKDADSEVQSYVGLTLLEIDKSSFIEVIPVLSKTIKRSNPDVRALIFNALGKLGENAKEAIPTLIQVAMDRYYYDLTEKQYIYDDATYKSIQKQAIQVLLRLGELGRTAVKDAFRKNPIRYSNKEFAESWLEADPSLEVANIIITNCDFDNFHYCSFIITKFGAGIFPILQQVVSNGHFWFAEDLLKIDPNSRDVAISSLIKACDGKDTESLFAIDALGRIGSVAKPDAISVLERKVEGGDPKYMYKALEALSVVGQDESAVTSFIIKYADSPENLYLSNMAVGLLKERIPLPKETLPDLIKLYSNSKDDCIRNSTFGLVGSMGEHAESAVPSLILQLSDPVICRVLDKVDYVYQENMLADTIIKIGSAAVPHLVDNLITQNNLIRFQIIKILIKLGPIAKGAVTPLINILTDRKLRFRYEIINILGAIGPEAKDAVPELILSLSNTSSEVRINAAIALGKIGREAQKAIPALRQLQKDKQRQVVEAANKAISQIQ
jgi:HEAT repeat protein